MSSVARKTKAHLDLEKEVVELKKRLASTESTKDYYCKLYNESKEVMEGLHEVLDDLGIRGYKDEYKNNRLTLTVRLFAWAMSLANKGKEL